MFSVSDLSEEQIKSIKGWVSEGAQMADVQKRLTEDFGFKVTYMDTRFLSLDLELEFHVEEEPEDDEEVSELVGEAPEAVIPGPDGAPAANVNATLDQVARPGAMVSGTVTFSDGMKGLWMIDEQGRPSVDPDQAGYQPTEADLIAFQDKLRVMLDGHM
jgi:hypothetical protein